jgi:hypothetical protein
MTPRVCAGAAVLLFAALLAGALPASASAVPTGEVRGYASMCADAGNSPAPRARVQVRACVNDAAQQWTFDGGELHHGGMCMNDKGSGGSGSPVISWPCDGAANEEWTWFSATGAYVLKAGGLCLDDPAFPARNGTRLIVYRCTGGANQRWSLPSSPGGCHPLTSGGNCYEPGEFCRASDHGVTGVAGDGETITCEDVNGWRWEPS